MGWWLLLVCVSIILFDQSNGKLTTGDLFSSYMVLQSDQNALIWGEADINTVLEMSISLELSNDHKDASMRKQEGEGYFGFNSSNYSTKSDSNGQFVFKLDPFPASHSNMYTLLITNTKTQEKTKFEKVVFGHVWICSGQSNMEFNVAMAYNATKEIQESINYPYVRVFSVDRKDSNIPLKTLKSRNPLKWQPSSPDSVGNPTWYTYFSAMCYFFGREQWKATKVPVGLISSAWVGTRIEAWSSPDALSQCKSTSNEKEYLGDPNQSSVLYNGMIYPLIPLKLKGFVWYQGSANIDYPDLYECQLPSLIQDWRNKFMNKDLSFYVTQLAPYNVDGKLARMRQAQRSSLQLQNVAMATAFDLADPDAPDGEIHFRNKQEIGRRLSLCSQFYDFKLDVDPVGPAPVSVQKLQIAQNEWRITINYQSKSVIQMRGTEKCFSCCQYCPFDVEDNNGKWTRATECSVITEKQVQVTIRSFTTAPKGIRYAWSDVPQCAIYDNANMVSFPFTTTI